MLFKKNDRKDALQNISLEKFYKKEFLKISQNS